MFVLCVFNVSVFVLIVLYLSYFCCICIMFSFVCHVFYVSICFSFFKTIVCVVFIGVVFFICICCFLLHHAKISC